MFWTSDKFCSNLHKSSICEKSSSIGGGTNRVVPNAADKLVTTSTQTKRKKAILEDKNKNILFISW